jgi:hypothetical protein
MQDEKDHFHHIQVFIQAIRLRKQKVNNDKSRNYLLKLDTAKFFYKRVKEETYKLHLFEG